MKTIDLHVHSTASDGTLAPEALVPLATKQKLSALALTDHDTTAGILKAKAAAEEVNIELISGIELSTNYEGREVHILGLYIDENDPSLQKKLTALQDIRTQRNLTMAQRLREEGFDITLEQLMLVFPHSILTRAHFAKYLMSHGSVKSMEQVFQKYLGNGCRCYVPREKPAPADAIRLIHESGGLAFFAHPILCNMNYDHLKKFIHSLVEDGLDGIEAIYSTYSPKEEATIKKFAAHFNILISGGSDFHGTNKPYIQLGTGKGSLAIPYEILDAIKLRRRQAL